MRRIKSTGAVLLISLVILIALSFGAAASAAGLPVLPDLSLIPLTGDELRDQALLEAREKLAEMEQRYEEIRQKTDAQPAGTLDAHLSSANNREAFSALFSGGTGTERDPYIITTPEQLNAVRNDLTACYRLGSDIDLSGYGAGYDDGKGWQPVGSDSQPFEGTLDGNGYKVTNLFINRPWEEVSREDYIGLFGYSTGVIKNLRLEEHTVAGTEATCVGGLVGANDGSIECCFSAGDVAGGIILGGLVGENYGTIRMSSSTGAVTSGDDGFYAGGLVGENYGIIEICSSTVSVTTTSAMIIGGLAGQNWNTIQKCYSTGDIRVAENGLAICTGGLVGHTQDGSIENCYSTGNIQVDGSAFYSGGLVGYMYYSTIENCYSTGDIQGDGGAFYSGGLVGENDGGTIVRCYYENDTVSNGLGTSKSTAEMMQRDTFAGWDFDNIWGIMEGTAYPFLRPLAVMIVPSNADIYLNEGQGATALSGIVYTRTGISLSKLSASSGEISYSGSGPWYFDLVFDQLDGPQTFSSTVTAVGEYVYANTAVYNITVANLPPTPSIAGAPAGNIAEGSAVNLSASATDPGSADTEEGFTYEWLVNDIPTANGSSFTFIPANNGAYTIKLKATDKDDGTGETSVVITVDNVAPAPVITSAPEETFVNREVSIGAAFTDPAQALDGPYTAAWDWGDGSPVDELTNVTYGTQLNAGHKYTEPGFYTITITVTDKDGGSNKSTCLIRVIDASLSVTGAGTFTSPKGAVAAQPKLSGPAMFQLASTYPRGKSAPIGLFSFQFLQGKMLFTGTSQEWLCAGDKNIWLKGKGILNLKSGYSYLLSGVDARTDAIRLQIWDKSGKIVYDNEPGADLYDVPNTPLSKGSFDIKGQQSWR